MEDGWKGQEGKEQEQEEEQESSEGEDRQSHEEHMRQLAGMARSPSHALQWAKTQTQKYLVFTELFYFPSHF